MDTYEYVLKVLSNKDKETILNSSKSYIHVKFKNGYIKIKMTDDNNNKLFNKLIAGDCDGETMLFRQHLIDRLDM